MSSSPAAHPIRPLDQLVADVLDLEDRIDELTRQRATLRAHIADYGLGKHPTSLGVTVTVSPPARRFDPKIAETLLSDEQLALCRPEGYDAAKMKRQLPPVLLDECMVPGNGNPVVTIR